MFRLRLQADTDCMQAASEFSQEGKRTLIRWLGGLPPEVFAARNVRPLMHVLPMVNSKARLRHDWQCTCGPDLCAVMRCAVSSSLKRTLIRWLGGLSPEVFAARNMRPLIHVLPMVNSKARLRCALQCNFPSSHVALCCASCGSPSSLSKALHRPHAPTTAAWSAPSLHSSLLSNLYQRRCDSAFPAARLECGVLTRSMMPLSEASQHPAFSSSSSSSSSSSDSS